MFTGRSVGPDGTRFEQNAQARLKILYKHAGQLVDGNVKEIKKKEKMRLKELLDVDCGCKHILISSFKIILWLSIRL